MNQLDERVAVLRAFNRRYTRTIGLLDDQVYVGYPLPEARVLFELGQQQDTEVSALRTELNMDAGQLSRLLGKLADRGLLTKRPCPQDARKQWVRLTEQGKQAFAELDHRAAEQLGVFLGQLTEPAQHRLVAALGVVDEVLHEPPNGPVVIRAPRPGDLGWVVQRHGQRYAAEYGWNAEFEALVARIVADYANGRDQSGEAAWIAELAGEPVGCVFCARESADTAKLRLLLVEPAARGHGIGGLLVNECIEFARSAGYQTLELWTNDVLGAARRIYQRAGFELVSSEPHHSFGHDLVGEYWRRTLR
ncbi:MarR family transcriptional regulator with acetyltransferase activity [Tamaricihabitans halophyticus]|uniref:MarR family transcriptional regulator with acetyltransferase activity n=1 Tax=Tamaricihabitans halophyticus TaxID=1262583 RepID=A0A4R2R5N0_9PSEU|nr:bifunctional helix-turn-helix transcriptional regulator/GNAT family N-acetyltransferase [Tamaricihabitans halophyticus]TCP57337.1 MarR family transcriptional regulator with acetyltransferase activity [Tamaricihabitans halophyticus]